MPEAERESKQVPSPLVDLTGWEGGKVGKLYEAFC